MTNPTSNVEWTVLRPEELPASAQEFQAAFNAEVIGQEQAQAIALNAHERANNPLRDPTKPIGIYVLIGPSRTGKTRTAKITAKLTHKDERALTILESGDYIEPHQMLDLTGAAPTYVGYVRPDEVRRLDKSDVDGTSKVSGHNMRRVRLNSDSNVDIVCLNEFEKATPEFFRFWMGAWDNGYTVHGNGVKTDYSNTIFFLTMNLGMEEVEKLMRGPIGFSSGKPTVTSDDIQSIVEDAMKKRWPPEFRNRLTKVVIFRPLTPDEILQICSLELKDVQNRINTRLKKPFTLEVTAAAKAWLVADALQDNGSVAQLKRVVETRVSDVLGRELHKGSIRNTRTVQVDVSEDGKKLVFKAARDVVPVPAENATKADTLPYRLKQAKDALRHGDVQRKHFKITLMTNKPKEAADFNADLEQALNEVFEVAVESEYQHKGEPYIVSKSVFTSLDMAFLIREIFQSRYPQVQVDGA